MGITVLTLLTRFNYKIDRVEVVKVNLWVEEGKRIGEEEEKVGARKRPWSWARREWKGRKVAVWKQVWEAVEDLPEEEKGVKK